MTDAARVLVIDDEPQIRRLLSLSLKGHGYEVQTADSGETGLDLLATEPFDLLLLDLGLPDMDGLEVCREVRQWSAIPIIVVSVREDESDKIAALDLGADDYVTKPFSTNELLARVRASLRRAPNVPEEPVISLGQIHLDVSRRLVTRNGTPIHLTPTEYDLLRVLTTNVGKVVTHRQLLREARGPGYEGDTPVLRVHLVSLRRKLGTKSGEPGYIATEPGIGYRLLE